MASFRLTKGAKHDLARIYLHGLRRYGEAQADKYYNALFDRFDQIAEQPFCTKLSTNTAQATGATYVAQIASTIELSGARSKSRRLSASKMRTVGFRRNKSFFALSRRRERSNGYREAGKVIRFAHGTAIQTMKTVRETRGDPMAVLSDWQRTCPAWPSRPRTSGPRKRQ